MFACVLSPAKTLDTNLLPGLYPINEPLFFSKALKMAMKLKDLSPNQLSQLMGISEKLAESNYERFQNFSKSALEKQGRPAILFFKGDVYQGLEAHSLTKSQLQTANGHISILSGLYGLLNPLDTILAYRLEMGCPFSYQNKKNLYEFWKDDLTQALEKKMQENGDKVLLNLASKEYFSALCLKKFSFPVVECVFENLRKGQYRVISFLAKKARGKMARYLIEKKPKNLKSLEGFQEDGYLFCPKTSTDERLVFKSQL